MLQAISGTFKMNLPLVALAIGAFGIGVTEFAPMGLLPVMAGDFGISIPAAGLMVSGYAIGVVIGAPLLILPTTRVPRKTLLVGLMALFTVGNLLSALAPTYPLLILARLVTSLCHGPFFGVGSVVAAGLVPPERRASAVAAMFMGLTIANVGGVPLATWVGQHVGWRITFAQIAVLGAGAVFALQRVLPPDTAGVGTRIGPELAVIWRADVLQALATTVLAASSMFTVFTYIAPILMKATHASGGYVTLMLAVYGAGLTVGNYLGGRFANTQLARTLLVVFAAVTLLLTAFAASMTDAAAAAINIFLWGIGAFALVPALQSRVMVVARDAPNLAASLNIAAFNLGNAVGAAVGGSVIAAGFGYPAVSLTGAAFAACGFLLVLAAQVRRPAAR